MINLQQDLTDVIARDLAPHISKIIGIALHSSDYTFTAKEK